MESSSPASVQEQQQLSSLSTTATDSLSTLDLSKSGTAEVGDGGVGDLGAADTGEQSVNLPLKQYSVANFYKRDSLFANLARNSYFEYLTLSVISLNAIWIGIDT